MIREELRQSLSRTIDELSVIRGHAEDAYSLGDAAEIAINGHKMTASIETLAHLCDFINLAIKDAQTDYEKK